MVAAASSPSVTAINTNAPVSPAQVPRLVSVDVLRGLVMVIMALDHVRDFMSYPRFPPEDMTHTNGALFFTRFVTHFCAPVFAFLAGTGAFLATSRGKSIQEVSRFFLTRGLWLVLLEFTIIDFAWGFVPWAHAGVIWVLGWSMVAMALIVRLPVRWIGALGLGMIATHNLLDRINPASFGKLSWLWIFLHSPGRIPVGANLHLSCKVRPDSVGWCYGCGFCFWKSAAPPRPPQMDSDARDLRDDAVLRAPRVQFLRKRYRRAAVTIPIFWRPMECSADGFVDGDLILQHAQVSAFSRLPAYDTRAVPHPAWAA